MLVTSDGSKLSIDKIEKEPRVTTVYNFEVADFQSYFVSNLGVWVHNCAIKANYGKLTYDGNGKWSSTAGLIYEPGSVHGNRVKHVLAHGTPDPTKDTHTVFNVSKNEILGLVDEAWSNKYRISPVLQRNSSNMFYNIPMGRVIGINGETSIRIVVKKNNPSVLITAFPVR